MGDAKASQSARLSTGGGDAPSAPAFRRSATRSSTGESAAPGTATGKARHGWAAVLGDPDARYGGPLTPGRGEERPEARGRAPSLVEIIFGDQWFATMEISGSRQKVR